MRWTACRSTLLAAALGAVLAPPSQASTSSRISAPRIAPGIYLSASVALSLQPDGTFLLQELGGTRRATGRYTASPSMLVFASGRGDVGRTRFPLKCRVADAFGGFRVVPGQSGCKPFEGLSFRTAN